MIAAIVAAAGLGVRMGNATPKPYLLLAGKPILAHTLGVFEKIKEIQEVTLVVHPEELDYCQEKVISPYGFKKVLRLVPGGKERQDSVYNALKALKNEDELEIVLVHDGVRPFFTGDQVRRLIQAARSHGGAVLGLPAQDTLKTVTAEGEIRQTLERQRYLADPDAPGLSGAAAAPRLCGGLQPQLLRHRRGLAGGGAPPAGGGHSRLTPESEDHHPG